MEPLDERVEPQLIAWLDILREIPPRQAGAAVDGKAAFLVQAQGMVSAPVNRPAVSLDGKRRPMGWKETIQTLIGRKERSPMFITLVSIIVSASILLGGGGAAVYASQDSLPGEPLYAVKQLGETVRLDLAGGPQAHLALELGYANRRIEEIRQLAGQGKPLSEALEWRYQQQMEAVFSIAAGLNDTDLLPALERIHKALRNQDRILQRGPGEGGGEAEPNLERVREQIRLNLHLVENGLKDPKTFRHRVREGAPGGKPPVGPGEPGQDPGGCPGCPDPSVTPSPQKGASPGPNTNAGPGPASTAAPQGGPHNDPGGPEASGEGHNGTGTGPQATQEPVIPGSGSGNGDGGCDECGDGPHSPQPTAVDPGRGDDSGAGKGDGDCDGCGAGPSEPQPPSDDPGGSQDGSSGSGDGTCDGCDGSGEPHHPEDEDGGGHNGGSGDGSGERHRP